MTDHPVKRKSDRAAFEQIATGTALPQASNGTLSRLVKAGLIVRDEDKQLGDRFGKFSIPQYHVPTPVHMQFCQWASEQPDIVEEAERLEGALEDRSRE